MSFRSYLYDRAQDLSLGQTQRDYCRDMLQNDDIPLESEDSEEILDAVNRMSHPQHDALYVFARGMLIAYQHKARKIVKAPSGVQGSAAILREVFHRCDCYEDSGELREQFRQCPELLLLAAIARGLFDIADAIREN